MIKNVYWYSGKDIPYSCQMLIKLKFYLQFFEKYTYSISNFIKIRPVGAELFHT
jgi:hypothetical protein